jgi:hypothetical protein
MTHTGLLNDTLSKQLSGTKDVRDVFKAAVQEQGRNFVRGTTSTDAHRFLTYVSNYHYHHSNIYVRYSFKHLGFNDIWDLDKLQQCLSRPGKYVFFGATRKNNPSHKKMLATITNITNDEEKIVCWSKNTQLYSDHAIGVFVNDDFTGTIYDNGCVNGEKYFSIQNLATRMRCVNDCYFLDVFIC